MAREQVIRTVTSSTRPTGVEGCVIFETDTEKMYCYTGAAWSLIASLAAYESYTATVTQGATPTQSTTYGAYHRSGRRISGAAITTIGTPTTGTAANAVVVTLPVAIHASYANMVIGEGFIFDNSAGFFYYGLLRVQSTTTAQFLIRTAGAGVTYLGSTSFTAALAQNDVVSFEFNYEAAAAS